MIGTALVHALFDRGHDVVGNDLFANKWSDAVDDVTLVGDIAAENTRAELPDTIDIVVHLAANSRVPESVGRPVTAVENVESTYGALEYAKDAGATGFLLASSREVYGDAGLDPTPESETDIQAVENPYGASKVGSEALARSYEACYGLDSGILRLSNVYGRYDMSDRVVPTFVARSMRGDELVVYGDDKVLDFLHVDDCVDGLVTAIEQFDSVAGTAINLGSGTGTTLSALAKTVVDVVRSESNIRIETSRRGEVDRFVADIERAVDLLEFEPKYELREGVAAAVSWYENGEGSFGGYDS